MAEQTIELTPGESKVVSFEAVPHEARTYQVSVNGLVGSFKAITKTVSVNLKNPPNGATKWQLIIYDWNKKPITSKFSISVPAAAVFEIPPETIFPLRVDMVIYHDGTIDYRMQSMGTEFPFPSEWFVEAYIPDYGNYYYNVATEQFEGV